MLRGGVPTLGGVGVSGGTRWDIGSVVQLLGEGVRVGVGTARCCWMILRGRICVEFGGDVATDWVFSFQWNSLVSVSIE